MHRAFRLFDQDRKRAGRVAAVTLALFSAAPLSAHAISLNAAKLASGVQDAADERASPRLPERLLQVVVSWRLRVKTEDLSSATAEQPCPLDKKGQDQPPKSAVEAAAAEGEMDAKLAEEKRGITEPLPLFF